MTQLSSQRLRGAPSQEGFQVSPQQAKPLCCLVYLGENVAVDVCTVGKDRHDNRKKHTWTWVAGMDLGKQTGPMVHACLFLMSSIASCWWTCTSRVHMHMDTGPGQTNRAHGPQLLMSSIANCWWTAHASG